MSRRTFLGKRVAANAAEQASPLRRPAEPREKTRNDRETTTAAAGGLADAANASTISQPSPYPQPGVRATELRTGATRVHSSGGFVSPVAVQHLCFPPEGYPQDCGPGTRWRCACNAVWEAWGITVHKYPQGTGFRRHDVVLGPDYWEWVPGTGTDTEEHYLSQQGLWDWRPSTDKIHDLLVAHLRGE